MKIFKKLVVVSLGLCMLICLTNNVNADNIQQQKKKTILNTLKEENLISPEVKNFDTQRQEDILCLALNMYHEARGSTVKDQIATSYVVFNRMATYMYPLNSKNKNKNICDIVFDKWQFCWTNGTKVGVPYEKQSWDNAQKLAIELLKNKKHLQLAESFDMKHYVATPLLTDSSRPKWIDSRKLTISIGQHSYMAIQENIPHNTNNIATYSMIIDTGFSLIFDNKKSKNILDN